ncbi:uncharacterized protein LOC133146290 [Syngnathus typhle]|uniref:uncharacterized protein LOC133146290 n=1 Tax=Syngnathus typhle TaxID=161592 RepID=UPI002A6A802E|nr:uncharacterized protein LOC133146290 [Syngnathus typhle]
MADGLCCTQVSSCLVPGESPTKLIRGQPVQRDRHTTLLAEMRHETSVFNTLLLLSLWVTSWRLSPGIKWVVGKQLTPLKAPASTTGGGFDRILHGTLLSSKVNHVQNDHRPPGSDCLCHLFNNTGVLPEQYSHQYMDEFLQQHPHHGHRHVHRLDQLHFLPHRSGHLAAHLRFFLRPVPHASCVDFFPAEPLLKVPRFQITRPPHYPNTASDMDE